jgi:preprotein translocase subunit YajC
MDYAYAMAGQGEAGPQGFAAFLPLILIFIIFYFLLIRPQQKKAKQQKQFIDNLKKGEAVVTGGGLHGKITGLAPTIVTLEVADKVRVKISRNQIVGRSDLGQSQSEQK